jgi:mannosyl-oligosaccharide alpha-1,3-glucosidase
MRWVALFGALSLLIAAPEVHSVKSHDFKTCSQSGFCRRGRALSSRAKEAATSWKSPYSVDPDSVSILSTEATAKASVKSSLYPDIKFSLETKMESHEFAWMKWMG